LRELSRTVGLFYPKYALLAALTPFCSDDTPAIDDSGVHVAVEAARIPPVWAFPNRGVDGTCARSKTLQWPRKVVDRDDVDGSRSSNEPTDSNTAGMRGPTVVVGLSGVPQRAEERNRSVPPTADRVWSSAGIRLSVAVYGGRSVVERGLR